MDEAGLPIRLSISPGQASDKAAAPVLIDSLTRTAHVVADRGYDAMALVEQIEARGAVAHIPTQRDRKVQRSVDRAIYRQRNLVERYFNKLKHFRRIAPLRLPGYGVGRGGTAGDVQQVRVVHTLK